VNRPRTRHRDGSDGSDHVGSTLLVAGTVGVVGLATLLVLSVRGGSLSFSILGATLSAAVNPPHDGADPGR
jgi:hypothetical protein